MHVTYGDIAALGSKIVFSGALSPGGSIVADISLENPIYRLDASHVTAGRTARHTVCAEGTCDNSRGIHLPEREDNPKPFPVLKGRWKKRSSVPSGRFRLYLIAQRFRALKGPAHIVCPFGTSREEKRE